MLHTPLVLPALNSGQTGLTAYITDYYLRMCLPVYPLTYIYYLPHTFFLSVFVEWTYSSSSSSSNIFIKDVYVIVQCTRLCSIDHMKISGSSAAPTPPPPQRSSPLNSNPTSTSRLKCRRAEFASKEGGREMREGENILRGSVFHVCVWVCGCGCFF